jgi:hypothetical protein
VVPLQEGREAAEILLQADPRAAAQVALPQVGQMAEEEVQTRVAQEVEVALLREAAVEIG